MKIVRIGSKQFQKLCDRNSGRNKRVTESVRKIVENVKLYGDDAVKLMDEFAKRKRETDETTEDTQLLKAVEIIREGGAWADLLTKYHKDIHETQVAADSKTIENLSDAEKRLLPLALERGAAIIVNRPFDGGDLFGAVGGKPLPGWAREIDCANWAQVFLKFVVSHPAVTCAIPATSNPAHMRENMGALAGRMPDAALRRRMAAEFDRL